MLILVLSLTWCLTRVNSFIPPSNVCYQHVDPQNACVYGNLTVSLIGKTLVPKDCNSHVTVKDLQHPPFIYINSTNSTERFTVMILDVGPQGRGPDYLHWMVTNVSINTLPSYQNLPPNDVVADYQQPLLMSGETQPHLIQILVFRHQNVLRVPFGELWITRRRGFSLSTLFSNTSPNLRLCGPVAGTQYWVHDNTVLISQSAPSAPNQPSAPLPPIMPGVAPLPGYPPSPVQPGYAPAPVQPGYVPAPGQPGYAPVPVQPGYAPPVQPGYVPNHGQPPMTNYPKKSSGVITRSIQILFVPLAMFTILFL